jgi:hypothetical protein
LNYEEYIAMKTSDIEDSYHESKGLLISPLGGQIIASKVYLLPDKRWIKNDGELAVTLQNIHVTLYHVRHDNGTLSTQGLVDLSFVPNTQNDKGTHHAYLDFYLLGASNNRLTDKNIHIILPRDICTPGTLTSGIQDFGLDFYEKIAGVGYAGHMDWDYEGKC